MIELDKFEMGVLERSLRRSVSAMRGSKYIGEEDLHFLKCEALLTKVKEASNAK